MIQIINLKNAINCDAILVIYYLYISYAHDVYMCNLIKSINLINRGISMKACVLHKKHDLRYEEVEDPIIKNPHEVKVKILTAGICGSDQHYYHEGGIGSSIVVREPMIIGHEGCGIVQEVGESVTSVKVGDFVVLRPARPCFECHFCKQGQYTYCEHMQHIGSAALYPHTQGLFADYVVVHETQCFDCQRIDPSIAAFAEPLGVAYNGVRSLGEIIGKNILVMGAGPIGILCASVAKVLGAKTVSIIDIRNNTLEVAQQMGVDYVCNSKKDKGLIAKWSEHKGFFDATVEATGNGYACIDAMRLTKPMGVISQVGMFGSNMAPADLGQFMTKGLDWKAVFRFYDEFEPCINALKQGFIDPTPMISASFDAQNCQEALEAALSPDTCKVQIVLNKV